VLGTRHPVALTQLRRRPLSSCRASFWFVVDCAFLWKVMTTSRRLVSHAGRLFRVRLPIKQEPRPNSRGPSPTGW
jgi:hypothetical protein